MNSTNIPKSFCILPWVHTSIEPDGTVRPCCMTEYTYRMGDLNETPLLKDIFNSEKYKTLRKKMINGPELPAVCRSCKIQEESGATSYRQRKNEEFKDVIDTIELHEDGSAEFIQLYIDYRFSNKCNFKCITCGPSLSTSHALEMVKLGNAQSNVLIEVKDFAEQFKSFSKDIREIYFAGGEPLIIDHHYEILNMFIESQQPVYVHYNTNLSEINYKGINVLDLWSKINGYVKIGASIDGFDASGETIRFGLDSEVFKSNIKKITTQGSSNVKLNFNITFGVTNYHNVVETTRELLSLMPPDYEFYINYNPIFFPAAFAVHILSAEQIADAVELITKQIDELEQDLTRLDTKAYNVFNAVKFLRSDFLQVIKDAPNNQITDNREEVILKAIERLDNQEKIRKTNWRRDLPLMYRDWQQILKDERSK
jgi:radical SAM protein with 4Fe4S-binding SPASM domain